MEPPENSSKENTKASNDLQSKEALQVIAVAQKANPNIFKGINSKQKAEIVKGLSIGITQIKSHSGPLPDPEDLIQYNEVIPNGGERIMAMAEKEQDFRHGHTRNVAKRRLDQEVRGQWFGFILAALIVCGGIYLLFIGKNLAGFAAIIIPIAGIIGAFIYTKSVQSKNSLQQ